MAALVAQSKSAVALAAQRAEAYLNLAETRAISPSLRAIEGLARFDELLPDGPSDPLSTIRLLDEFGSPATTITTAGRYFGLVVGGTLPAALGARILASAWDQVAFNDATSPIAVKLEQVATRWLLALFGLPDKCSVGFVSGATMGNFTCIAAARHALLERQGWDVQKQGLNGAPRLRIVAGKQIHVTVMKALSMLGLGTDKIEWVACDDQGRMMLDDLPSTDETTLILTQAGNVHSGACDPIGAVAEKAGGAWVHVDGAFGLWAAASPSTRSQIVGFEAADSWVTDGHKWLNTAYDSGLAICRHPAAIHAAMATQAPYLKAGGTAAPKDMVPEFSRSARGVEVWAALHSLGREGIRHLIDRSCQYALTLATGLEELGFEILNDVVLNQVVATVPGFEARSRDIAQHVQTSGEAWFGPTTWQGREAIRFSIASWATTDTDIQRVLRAVATAKQTLAES
ncbi:MAG: aspartate aminotransferase family protein [Rhizobiaceae bacterium]|nr:aspartate aminotransferase family protein [Rhizobiaceae bacterium]